MRILIEDGLQLVVIRSPLDDHVVEGPHEWLDLLGTVTAILHESGIPVADLLHPQSEEQRGGSHEVILDGDEVVEHQGGLQDVSGQSQRGHVQLDNSGESSEEAVGEGDSQVEPDGVVKDQLHLEHLVGSVVVIAHVQEIVDQGSNSFLNPHAQRGRR